MDRKIRLIWDFYGGDATGTAEHHTRHLVQFMEREKLELLNSGTNSAEEYHTLAYITVWEKDVKILRDTLRPNRAIIVE